MVRTKDSLENILIMYKLQKADLIETRKKGIINEIKETVPKIRKAGLYSMILSATLSFAGYCSVIYDISTLKNETTIINFVYDSRFGLASLIGGANLTIISWVVEYLSEKRYKRKKEKEFIEEDVYGYGGLSGILN